MKIKIKYALFQMLGFLNFFLWASDLWFLYKETPWFKLKQSTGVTPAA
jgi:hypothetical protein